MREKEILLKIRPSDYVVLLHSTFQDQQHLYFLMSLCCNEDLFFWAQRYGSFEPQVAKYYTWQMVNALEYIHSQGVVHRDVKPENILLDDHMRIKMGDFGSAMVAPQLAGNWVWAGKASTFVGTAEYVAPEILNSKPATPATDFWSLGCVLFRLVAGSVPFTGPNDYFIFQKIEKLEYEFPEGFPDDARSLVTALLQIDPKARLGLGQVCQPGLRQHAYFADCNPDPLALPPRIDAFLPPRDGRPPLRGSDSAAAADFAQMAVDSLAAHPPPPLSRLRDESQRAAVRAEQAAASPWAGFCTERETILLAARAIERRGLQCLPTHVVFFSSGRLLVLAKSDLSTLHDVGLCDDDEQGWAQLLAGDVLFVHTLRRTYYFVFEENVAASWVVTINCVAGEALPSACASLLPPNADASEHVVPGVPGAALFSQWQSAPQL